METPQTVGLFNTARLYSGNQHATRKAFSQMSIHSNEILNINRRERILNTEAMKRACPLHKHWYQQLNSCDLDEWGKMPTLPISRLNRRRPHNSGRTKAPIWRCPQATSYRYKAAEIDINTWERGPWIVQLGEQDLAMYQRFVDVKWSPSIYKRWRIHQTEAPLTIESVSSARKYFYVCWTLSITPKTENST